MPINDLSPAALKAAMRTGMDGWGSHGSVMEHAMYVEPQDARRGQFRKCQCGCGQRAKFRAMANGVCMASGCEFSMWQFVKKFTRG